MAIPRDDVLKALRNVRSQNGEDIIRLGMVRAVEVQGVDVTVRVAGTVPTSEARDQLKSDIERAVREALAGVGRLEVEVEFAVPQSKGGGGAGGVRVGGHAQPMQGNPVPGVKHVLLVGSGKGGVGKSTVAVNLAVTLARMGRRTGLLDMDVYGPSIPTMFGLFGRPEIEGEVLIPVEKHGVKLMSIGFLIDPDQAVVWRGPMLHGTAQQFLSQVQWGELEVLVVDLPPGTGDVQLSISQMVPVTGAVVVSTPQEVALSDVRRAVAMFEQLKIPVLGLVENMSYFVCEHGGEYDIFGRGGARKWAGKAGIPFLGEIPIVPRIRECGDRGSPAAAEADHPAAGALNEVARNVLAGLERTTSAAPVIRTH